MGVSGFVSSVFIVILRFKFFLAVLWFSIGP